MNIYFAASIRGGRDDQEIYKDVIELLRDFGTVLTEHFGKESINEIDGTGSSESDIYQKDMAWVTQADVVVAEVTQPSLGVGYEIGRAEDMGKPILCLYREQADRTLSAMIQGNEKLTVRNYKEIKDVRSILEEFFAGLK